MQDQPGPEEERRDGDEERDEAPPQPETRIGQPRQKVHESTGIRWAIHQHWEVASDPQVIREELQWQRDIDGDKPKIEEFVAEIQQAETVRVFGWIKPEEAFIHIIHSIHE